jgi:hypothetical protein
MVTNAFEDRLRPEFDAEANSDEFVAQIPDYVSRGVRASTSKLNQHFPFTFQGAADDPVVYAALKQCAAVKPVSDGRAEDPVIAPAPISPPEVAGKSTSRLKMESGESKLAVRAQLPARGDWVELATYVMETNSRPYLHPVRDASGRVVLTEDRPADHVWQHGIFTGFIG